MDQAAPPDQILLWHQRERRKDPNPDCRVDLRAGRHRAKAAGAGGQPLPDSTGPQRNAFRETAHFTGSPATRLPTGSVKLHQPADSVRFIAGQLWSAYIDDMVRDHRAAIGAFEKEQDVGRNHDLTMWAGSTLRTLRVHLRLAEAAQRVVGIGTISSLKK